MARDHVRPPIPLGGPQVVALIPGATAEVAGTTRCIPWAVAVRQPREAVVSADVVILFAPDVDSRAFADGCEALARAFRQFVGAGGTLVAFLPWNPRAGNPEAPPSPAREALLWLVGAMTDSVLHESVGPGVPPMVPHAWTHLTWPSAPDRDNLTQLLEPTLYVERDRPRLPDALDLVRAAQRYPPADAQSLTCAPFWTCGRGAVHVIPATHVTLESGATRGALLHQLLDQLVSPRTALIFAEPSPLGLHSHAVAIDLGPVGSAASEPGGIAAALVKQAPRCETSAPWRFNEGARAWTIEIIWAGKPITVVLNWSQGRILKELFDRRPAPVTTSELQEIGKLGASRPKHRVKEKVSQIRSALRRALGLDTAAIEAMFPRPTEGGYCLVLPDDAPRSAPDAEAPPSQV